MLNVGAMMVEIVGVLREVRSDGSRFGPVESGQCGECCVRVETMDESVHCAVYWIDTLYAEDGCDCRSTDVLGFAVDERLGVHIATRASIVSSDRAVVQQSLRQTGHDEIEVTGGRGLWHRSARGGASLATAGEN
jgi:hypothetical protein